MSLCIFFNFFLIIQKQLSCQRIRSIVFTTKSITDQCCLIFCVGSCDRYKIIHGIPCQLICLGFSLFLYIYVFMFNKIIKMFKVGIPLPQPLFPKCFCFSLYFIISMILFSQCFKQILSWRRHRSTKKDWWVLLDKLVCQPMEHLRP